MNSVTRRIIKVCEVSVESALKIQERLEESGINFSECTMDELDDAIVQADMSLIRELGKALD